jgi:hypothetical protein
MSHLHLLPTGPNVDAVDFAPETLGRFGELREAIEVEIDKRVLAFAQEAARRRLPFELVLGLALERRSVLDDLLADGVEVDRARAELSAAAAAISSTTLRLGPGRLNRDYLRLLNHGSAPNDRPPRLGPYFACIPARLCERAGAVDLPTALDVEAIVEMLDWENAAVIEQRTMTEWAFRTLLAARRV